MPIDMGNDVLNELTSKQKYAIFDKAEDTCDDSHIQQYVAKLLDTYPQLINISNKIRNALCFAYNKHMTGEFKSTDCDYLYFWLGDKIYYNIKYILNFTSVIDVIKFTLQSKGGLSICEFDKYNIDPEYFMDTKELFDYSKDYDKLEHVITESNGSCSGDYTKILSNYVTKYNMFIFSCNNNPEERRPCEHIKEFFKDKYPEKFSALSCNSQYNNYKSVTQKQDHRGVAESRVKTLEQTTVKQPQELPRSGVPTDPYEDTNRDNLNHLNSEFHPSDIKDPKQSAIIDLSDSSSSNNMVMPPLVIGITVLSIILCKVT
ncbi:variable surface protein, partial [Plasmodium gonderi]